MNTEMTLPTLIPALTAIESQEVLGELRALLTTPHPSLVDFLSAIAFDGGTQLLSFDVQSLPVFRTLRTSGFNYALSAKMLAYVRFGVTTSRHLVVQSLILDGASAWVSHYYTADGKYSFSEGPSSHDFVHHSDTLFEANCPILNHLYNILSEAYALASAGQANTLLAHTIERTLRRIQKTNGAKLSISKGIHDPAIQAINDRLMQIEIDPVYERQERRALFANLKSERSRVIYTKKRAHQKSFLQYTLPLIVYDIQSAYHRFQARPLNNISGILQTLFIDPIVWFCRAARGSLGLAIAMAIYGPFTFFFITQPINPHAMSLVGVVRNAYIDTTDKIGHMINGNVITTTSSVKSNSSNSAADDTKKNYSELKPAVGNMLLSSDVPDVSNQTWDDRMSNFKSMQIAYEGNMEVAPRLGRLEQMETQLNWPLIVESTWMETERYLNTLNFYELNSKDYAPKFNEYVKAEKARVDQVQLYLWDRNVRFILDHPYTMMDESSEQTQRDYYVGRAFILLRDMTNNLARKHKGLPLPGGYDAILKLAQQFDNEYKSGGSVLDRLKANSKLFAQKDPQSTDELRHYMKRQWEILYLLQNHTQEASNFGLQVYIWSVRNAVYTLQSLYATKNAELAKINFMFKKGAGVNKLTNDIEFKQMDSQYEALYHMLVLEYTSVRKEIGESLKNDIEAVQRKAIIGGVESFLKERDTLLRGANLI
jgi:hypothetical protein